MNTKLIRSARAGFTLLEMMVVILIIGILSAVLVKNIPEMIDSAQMTASEQNMSKIYESMIMYQQEHQGSWPRDDGQRFFLRLWKDRYMDHTEKNAKVFFSPRLPYGDLLEEGENVLDHLDDWDSIGPGTTSYAGFSTQGDRQARRVLMKSPGTTAIVSDPFIIHRKALVYLTADGATHRLLLAEYADEEGLDFDTLIQDDIYVGPGCEIEILTTVSND
ncbi:MAG: type II secretion system protein [Planctomycetes bacterium]|jgi:prepilin-type N-terminal cleavage/methylation domain-containing protein|nr:type II secretion system protein [Planctomycetota bacterium]MBT4029726.1 type II secretion system protein [Planctomycetota bacterium]MBT4561226.1 type II secretion system protein [Planctomycetota bacterium]MBT5100510.1 type II secretion system protein [Planctomycetota bacterium]MBT5120780.1 type II secretion system protein [Planctomycetota bacterium]